MRREDPGEKHSGPLKTGKCRSQHRTVCVSFSPRQVDQYPGSMSYRTSEAGDCRREWTATAGKVLAATGLRRRVFVPLCGL